MDYFVSESDFMLNLPDISEVTYLRKNITVLTYYYVKSVTRCLSLLILKWGRNKLADRETTPTVQIVAAHM